MESKAFLKSMKVVTSGSCLSRKPSKILRRICICWEQLRPGRKPAWFWRRIGSTIKGPDSVEQNLVVHFRSHGHKRYTPIVGLKG